MCIRDRYNIIDSLFVAKIGEDAITALSLVYPVQNLINALAIGFGVGINAVISYHLGAGEIDGADAAATRGIACSIVHGVVSMIAVSYTHLGYWLFQSKGGRQYEKDENRTGIHAGCCRYYGNSRCGELHKLCGPPEGRGTVPVSYTHLDKTVTTRTEVLETYKPETVTKTDSSMEAGDSRVETSGITGYSTKTYKQITENGKTT